MRLQFKRDCQKQVTNFKFVTPAQETARLKLVAADPTKAQAVSGVQESYDLPLVGFVNYQSPSDDKAHPYVAAAAVGKGKDGYLLEIKQELSGAAKTAAAPSTASSAAAGSSAKPAASSTTAAAPASTTVKAR
jgi:hypothetical protein